MPKSLPLAAGTWLRPVAAPGPGRVSPTASPGSASRQAGEETLPVHPPDPAVCPGPAATRAAAIGCISLASTFRLACRISPTSMNPKNQVESCRNAGISRCLGCLDRRGPGTPDPRTGPVPAGTCQENCQTARPHQVINAAPDRPPAKPRLAGHPEQGSPAATAPHRCRC